MASALSIAIGQSLVFAILAPLGREVALNELQITSIIAVSALVFGVISPRWGRYSDRAGRKPVILIGLLGYSVGTVVFASVFQAGLMGLVSGTALYLLAMVFRCAQSSIMSATGPAATAYAADLTTPDQRIGAMAQMGAAHSMGTILGPAVSGALATFGLLAPLYFAGLLTAAAGIVTAFKLPKIPAAALTQRTRPRRLRYTDPRVVRYLVAAIGLFTGFSGIQQTLGFSIQDKMALTGIETAQMTGAALMISAIFAFLAQLLLVQRLKLKPDQFVYFGIVSLFIATLFIASFEQFWILGVGMAFMGTGLGVTMPSISAAASLAVTPEEQGAVAGLVASCPAMGFVVGPVIAGFLYQLNASYAGMFSATVFALLLAIMIISRERHD
ncbi:MAG: MFS transporter [Halieaceae bacterium]